MVANGTPSQQNVYLLDGMYNNDDRLGGSQGTQVRVVLDNIEEYQVLSNSYSAEYGGGAGAIINMGTDEAPITHGEVCHFRERNQLPQAFIGSARTSERTLQTGSGGRDDIRNRAHSISRGTRQRAD